MLTNLLDIKTIAATKTNENQAFVEFLQQIDKQYIDDLVQTIYTNIEPQIDCTQCGNCCKSLLINVTYEEANHLAMHLQINRTQFDSTYIEKGVNGMMLMNTMPCSFLLNNKCTVYEHRFAGCKEFPGLHLPNFKNRLFTTFMHYERCPIIFNVIENLKTATEFIHPTN